ncbi:MAG: GNAT family N-acetyltransferase [Candidatus Thorarchaeota archaeon]|nr:GNAT family N-acetyltransferase [Candidatus Thorarchaeota archaeon]
MKNSLFQSLPDGFEYGIVQTEEEMDKIIEFNEAIHGENDASTLRHLVEEYPDFRKEMNFYIRDTDKGIIVSALNAIPSTWDYNGILLKNLELGYVGTHIDYRNQGLLRALYLSQFENELFKGKYHISTIMGIPFFYRQFGYDFILPLSRAVMLDPREILRTNVKPLPSFEEIEVRPATLQDLPHIKQLYKDLCKRFLVTVRRDDSLWTLQERTHRVWERKFETFVMERKGDIEGYLRFSIRDNPKDHFHNSLDVIESSVRSIGAVKRTLDLLAKKCQETGLVRILLPGTDVCHLSRVALDLGGTMSRGWKFQIRIPNMLHFLKRIRPVLQRRLRRTIFENLTIDLKLDIYRTCYTLKIVQGNIIEVTEDRRPPPSEYFGIRMPPRDFLRLVLGEYDLDELSNYNTDFIVDGFFRFLLRTLFPKQESWISYYFV